MTGLVLGATMHYLLLNFDKAFDSVPHECLLLKVKFPGNKWPSAVLAQIFPDK